MRRSDSITVHWLTDEILACLRPPYVLVARWSAYVPLDELMAVPELGLCLVENLGADPVRLEWSRLPYGRVVVVPLDLHRATHAHLEATYREREALESLGGLFFDGRYLTLDDTVAAFFDSAAEARLGRQLHEHLRRLDDR